MVSLRKSENMNLCLGTVQFGMDYGIRKQKRPLLAESVAMFDYAMQNGINTFDTANAYGLAEEIIGVWIAKKSSSRNNIHIISKAMPNLVDGLPPENYYSVIKENLLQSLSRMKTDFLDAYLLHSARYVFNDTIIAALMRLKKEGYVKAIGVSVYEVEEANHGISHPDIDMIQLPYSIFDQRMLHGGVLESAKQSDCIIHARSAFLQGLILMTEQEVPDFLQKARPILRDIDEVCSHTGVSRIQLALGYVKAEESISHLVFGVDDLDQLKENITIFNKDIDKDIIKVAAEKFKNLETDIVMPSLWKR